MAALTGPMIGVRPNYQRPLREQNCPLLCRAQDYLETKRIAFPRFYFVAPADLLDILSKGSNPQLILRHLPKCFDNLHNMTFRKDENGDCTKVGGRAFDHACKINETTHPSRKTTRDFTVFSSCSVHVAR